jgi:hypothetical protein
MNVKITSADFKDWAREHRSLALAVCRAQAAAELTRARVDAYIKPIFESFGFVYSGELAESLDMRAGEKLVGKPLESEKDLYLCDDPRLQEYFDACDAAHRAHGYDNLPKGHCPALRMEHLLIKAQGALIECAEPLTGIERYMLIARDQDDKYVDLLIRACLAETSDEEIKSYIHPPHRLPLPQNQPAASH